MREIYIFFRLASRLANPFGHPLQVCTQVLVLQTCVDLCRLASPFGQGFREYPQFITNQTHDKGVESEFVALHLMQFQLQNCHVTGQIYKQG